MKRALKSILPLFALILVTACSQRPAEVHFGNDECVHCKMIISDARFASQMVTTKGKAVKFDAIECMAKYAGSHKTELEGAKGYVTDFNEPGQWIPLDQAILVRSEVVNSPMGAGLLALENEEVFKAHKEEYPGVKVNWQALVK